MLAFYLLGTVCFLEPKDHNLVARIAISIGIFAFVFSFDLILNDLKPIKDLNTLADTLLSLVSAEAIAFTISSVIGYRIDKVAMKNESKKWINRIYNYRVYDVLAVIAVSYALLYKTMVVGEVPVPLAVVVIIGLGWGLIFNTIFQYHKMQTRRRFHYEY